MAEPITDRSELTTTPASADVLLITDVDDTSGSTAGTSKKVTVDTLSAYVTDNLLGDYMEESVYDPASITEQLVGLNASQALTNKSINGVTLSTSGASSSYLDETGNYSTPAGGGDMDTATYDPASINEQLVGLTASQSLTNKSVNGVTLITSGASTSFLDATGAYSTPSGGGDAMTSDPLSQFASTTSAQLASVLSDETGTGFVVYSDSPTFTGTMDVEQLDFDRVVSSYTDLGSMGSSRDIDWSLTDEFYGTLNQASTTITFSNAQVGESKVLYLTGSASSTSITWSPTITWLNNGAAASEPAVPGNGGLLVIYVKQEPGGNYIASANGDYAVYTA